MIIKCFSICLSLYYLYLWLMLEMNCQELLTFLSRRSVVLVSAILWGLSKLWCCWSLFVKKWSQYVALQVHKVFHSATPVRAGLVFKKKSIGWNEIVCFSEVCNRMSEPDLTTMMMLSFVSRSSANDKHMSCCSNWRQATGKRGTGQRE